jgi:C_GCAxxG_C_C family probable redox protein
MDNRISTKSESYWGRRAVLNLIQKFNCPEATMQTFQDMIGRKEDGVLTAVAGLVGGVRGSTCGVVSAGALGVALMHADELQRDGSGTEAGVMALASDYVNRFGQTYGTTLCGERTDVDFWTMEGLLKYLLPGHRMVRCMKHINGSMQRLYALQDAEIPVQYVDTEKENIHCARDVLQKIREKTEVGDPILENISLVLDGGVALSGELCGALAGAVMALSLLLGKNLREVSMPGSYYTFFKGLTYLRSEQDQDAGHPYNGTRKITEPFESRVGSIRCREITGRSFSDWDDFQSYIHDSQTCRELIEYTSAETCRIIKEYRVG